MCDHTLCRDGVCLGVCVSSTCVEMVCVLTLCRDGVCLGVTSLCVEMVCVHTLCRGGVCVGVEVGYGLHET